MFTEINGTAWFSAGNGYIYRTLPASNYYAAVRSCAAIGATLTIFAPRNRNIMRCNNIFLWKYWLWMYMLPTIVFFI